ncbi:uncharacterized protein ARMOST_16810 [Armillaria ostoyae]|uniref:F-box domain-containing protein n=1 Tax=Armillaria ostoyae TaxID=47428 RepID=A0A284RX85_ARMOS|nr:uncharacterized protein ARMOST_16810 [Armillaria ostoyae]
MAPLRRSQRAATKKTQTYTESEPEDDHSKDYTDVAPIKKKPRVKKVNQEAENITQVAPKRRRLRGLLQKVAETPLDVLFEIFSNLEPLDLLRLSRTTKDLRALLLRRSSSFVWKRARENVDGLPPLPEDLSEPNFTFDRDNGFFNPLIPSFEFRCGASGRRIYYRYAHVPSIESMRKESDSFGGDRVKLEAWRLEKEAAFGQLRSVRSSAIF